MRRIKRNIKIVFFIVISFGTSEAYAQSSPTDTIPPDPARIAIYTVQNMHFGAFTQGALGGTVVVSNSGIRTVTGDVIGLNMGTSYFQAIFDVEAIVGGMISITNGPNCTLTGSNGGSMIMTIGSAFPGSPFASVVQPPSRTAVHIGGTLTVGTPASNPPGTYSGTFYITFHQE